MPPTDELPIKGKGAEAIKIPAIEKALDKYEPLKDRRCKAMVPEKAAKLELIAAIHKHADKLPKDEFGSIIYRYGDRVIYLESQEKLSILDADEDE